MSDFAQADMDRALASMTLDLENLQTDVLAKNRQIARLKGELDKQRGGSPLMADAQEVFDCWVDKLAKNKRTTFGPARQKAVLARLNEKALTEDGERKDDLLLAVAGMAKMPFVGSSGRQPDESGGAKRHDDLSLVCRDETTVERFMGYASTVEPAKVTPIRQAVPLDEWIPKCEATPLDRAVIALRSEFGDDTTHGDWSDEKQGFVCWWGPCPIEPGRPTWTAMKIRERHDGSALDLACFHGHSQEDLFDALRAVELRVDRRRVEAIQRARAA